MRNVHERTIRGDLGEAGALLDRVGGPDDVLWPAAQWEPMVLDRPLAVGATGGHGAVRYHVEAYEPGRRIVLRFHPRLALPGTHVFEVEPAGEGHVTVRHVIDARLVGRMRVLWPLVVRWLHDAVLEDLLDNAERELTGRVARPTRHSVPVRILRRATARMDRPPAVPQG
jgi:hypothetical protein